MNHGGFEHLGRRTVTTAGTLGRSAALLLAMTAGMAGMASFSATVKAQVPVPGTGYKVENIGDDFEDLAWSWIHNYPKSSHEMDEQLRLPTAQATNNRLFEGAKRGHPDYLVRVDTPAGGLPGSKGSLLMQTLYSGIPNSFTYKQQQDDLIVNVTPKLGGKIPIRNQPNFVVRVYIPPYEQWEKRTGVSFGVRAGLETTKEETKGSFIFKSTERVIEPYWPGMFIYHYCPGDGPAREHSAQIYVRSRRDRARDSWSEDHFVGLVDVRDEFHDRRGRALFRESGRR